MATPEKKSVYWEDIVKEIETLPKTHYKHFIPHFVYIDEINIGCLIKEGYKISRGDWNDVITNCLIIEW